MAVTSDIAWTHSTFNAWIGCTEVGPGCEHCYARALDARKRWDEKTHWGPGVPRKVMSDAYWRQPHTWNRKAGVYPRSTMPWYVFCSSLADVFDNEAPEGQRDRLWQTIRETPNLTWQIVTKRIGNAAKMLPPDWGDGWPNVWIIATMVNQDEVWRDLPKLVNTPARVRGISYEPALGRVSWVEALAPGGVHWLIVGGESQQPGSRNVADFPLTWAADAIAACRQHGVAPFIKQLGARPVMDGPFKGYPRPNDMQAGAVPAEWPLMLRVQEFPAAQRAG